MKNIKKLISLLLAMTLLISTFQSIIFAADTTRATVTVDNVYGSPEGMVDVNVMIEKNPGILGAIFTLNFDDGLILKNAVSGEAFSPLTMSKPGVLTSPCQFVWDGESISESQIKNGIILTLTFEISKNAVPGENLGISLSYSRGDVLDANLKPVTLEMVAGKVAVIDYTPGDLNDDNRINALDIVLMRRYITGGYDININEFAADINDDGKINTADIILVRRYIAGGYGIKLLPSHGLHEHTMEAIAAKKATCKEEGNSAYWHCTFCDNYYTDEDGIEKIELKDTVLPKTEEHDVVIDKGYAATSETEGLTDGSHCKLCGKVLVAQEIIPIISYDYSIQYVLYNENSSDSKDKYLATQTINNKMNPNGYNSAEGTDTLEEPTGAIGYTFLGWYDAPQTSGDAVRIRKIEAGTKGNLKLHAHWSEDVYDITYKLYRTPLSGINDQSKLTYTVSKGLADLPNPELYNYVFLGWYTDDGQEMTSIPVGSTGDITLNAYWTSRRNLTKAVSKLEDPIICENTDDGVIYFAYEIGTIENVPLTEKPIWEIQSVAGLAQQKSESVTEQITTEFAEDITETISKSTVDSSTWTLEENWNDSVEINETWAKENGMTVTEAEEKATTSSNTFSITNSNGGNETTTKNDGTTTLTYNSKNTVNEKGSHFDVNADLGFSKGKEESGKLSGKIKFPLKLGKDSGGEVGGEVGETKSTGFQIGLGGEYGNYANTTTDKHTGTDKTKVKTTINENTSTWNNSTTSSSTQTYSQSSSVSKALSEVISNTKGYGKSYSHGGSGSESLGLSNTSSNSVNTSSTLAYTTATIKTTTTTYSTDGKHEGKYRLILAGTIHVFGVVGYDVATKSYFTYTYNVMDDTVKEFLDYCPPEYNFDDYENGALPFEIPYYVHEYVTEKTAATSGLAWTTNTADGTATITKYNGTDLDVTIPSYISSSNTCYRVTGIEASTFAGKNVNSIILSDYITELPANAFKDCTNLKQVSGYFTKIGDNAFSGCTNLEKFNISAGITHIGENAFAGVGEINVKALDSRTALEYAQIQNPDLDFENEDDKKLLIKAAQDITKDLINQAIASGAQNIQLDISNITDGTVLTLDVPEITSFELQGGRKTYNDLKLSSDAATTSIKEVTVANSTRVPLEISSKNLKLDAVTVASPAFALLLSASSPTVTLIRDNKLISTGNDAVVWCNPNIVSLIVDNAIGTLAVSGNIYVCGNITGVEDINLTNGEIIYISENEFKNYIKGAYNVTFDATGGKCDVSDMTVFYGNTLETIPAATKDYHNFAGWFTEPDGKGTQITADYVFTEPNDVTVYAHWTLKEASGWVLESEMPEDAELVSEKWNYTLREYIENTNSSTLSGWTHYNTQRTGWGAWSDWSKSNPTNGTRNVESRSVYDHTEYHYYRWFNGHGTYTKKQDSSYWLEEKWFTYILPTSQFGTSIGYVGSDTATTIWVRADYEYNRDVDKTFTRSVNRTEWRYQEPIYTYYFYRDLTNQEAAFDPTGKENVSNVVRYVQYRDK